MSARFEPAHTLGYAAIPARRTSPASALGRTLLMCLILFPIVLFALFMLATLLPL